MSQNHPSDAASVPSSSSAPIATATRSLERRRWDRRAVVGVVAGIIVVALVGWFISGLPGLKGSSALSIALLLLAVVSGGLTVIYVVTGLRSVRLRKQAKVRDMVVVLVASLITAGIAIVEMIQAFQQLPR